MEIYSEKQLNRVLNLTNKIVILELVENEFDQNSCELHKQLKDFVKQNFNNLLLLKIKKTFNVNCFDMDFPNILVVKQGIVIKQIKNNKIEFIKNEILELV